MNSLCWDTNSELGRIYNACVLYMTVPSILTRVGSKIPIRDLVKKNAPDDFNVYIEPFVGSGVVYLHMDLDPAVKAVISDLDPALVEAHKIIKSNPPLTGISKYENLTPEQTERLVNGGRPIGSLGKLARYTAYSSGGFSGKIAMRKDGTYPLYKFADIAKKLRRIPETAEYMKNTTVLNQDYKTVIRKYDRPGAFIYLDPPYENSDGLYEFPDMDYDEMARVLSRVKGKFLMSINDSPNIRKIFKNFFIHKVVVRGGGNDSRLGGGK